MANRDIRNKRAFIEEIGNSLPVNYEAEKWEKAELSEIYKKIETIRKNNETIEKAKQVIENRDNKIRKFDADREIMLATLDREYNSKSTQIDTDIASLTAQIEALKVEKNGLAG